MRTTVLLVVLAGCVHVDSAAINPPPHRLAPRAPATVDVFASAPPERPHVDVALVTASSGGRGLPALVEAIRERAAELGCDAIVLSGSAGKNRGLLASCVVYTDTAVAARPAFDPR